MARLAVFASGRGSNFVAIAQQMKRQDRHSLEFLLCDQPAAPVLLKAKELGIPSYLEPYAGRGRAEAEKRMLSHLERHSVDLVALAGFMRLLTPLFLEGFRGEIVNVHPSLLPKYPGTHGIEESFRSRDRELGVTVMRIDEGCDTGPVIAQRSFVRDGRESLEQVEQRIHELEHSLFPAVLLDLLDGIDARRRGA